MTDPVTTAGRRGISSRMRPVDGPQRPWTSPLGPAITFPVIFDLQQSGPADDTQWRIEATLDLDSDVEGSGP